MEKITRLNYFDLLAKFKLELREDLREDLNNDDYILFSHRMTAHLADSSTKTVDQNSTAREIVKEILRRIHDLNIPHQRCMSPLKQQKFKSSKQEFINWLHKNIISKINLNETPSDELGGIIHLLVNYYIGEKDYREYCEVAITELLIAGLNPNLKNGLGHTFVESAIITKHLDAYKILGTQHSIKNKEYEIMTLISISKVHGFDVNTKDNLGNSIVHTAISSPYYEGNIIDLIKLLGVDFDINTRNNAGQNIVEYLKHCIENIKIYYNEFGYSNHEDISKHINNLKQQQQQIEEYIKIRNNPDYIAETTIFTNKLNSLKGLIVKNTRISKFLGKVYVLKFDIETITIEGLEDFIETENKLYEDLKIELIEYIKSYFGEFLAPKITNFIIGEKTTISSEEMINFIKLSGFLLSGATNSILKQFPSKDNVNETPYEELVIEWFKKCILACDEKHKNNGAIKNRTAK